VEADPAPGSGERKRGGAPGDATADDDDVRWPVERLYEERLSRL
jgi:hypothetical protein